MELEANQQVVRIFAQAINERDWQRLDAVVHPDFVRHSHSAPPVRGRDALKDYLRSEFEIFPDGHETIEDLVAEGDKVAVRHGFRGTQLGAMGPYPPSGKVMTADYLAIYRIADGRIIESWVEWDNLSGLRQLGHFPPATPTRPVDESQ